MAGDYQLLRLPISLDCYLFGIQAVNRADTPAPCGGVAYGRICNGYVVYSGTADLELWKNTGVELEPV